MGYFHVGVPSALLISIGTEIDTVLFITRILIGMWVVISTVEWFFTFGLFRDSGLLSWDVMSLRRGALFRRRWSPLIFGEKGVAATLAVRLAAGTVLIVTSSTLTIMMALTLLIVTYWLIAERSGFGADGSDQMGQLVCIGTLLIAIGKACDDPMLSFSGVLLIAGQLTVSYFVAGFAKMLSPTWRSGLALVGVMNTHGYGHPIANRISGGSASFSLVFCWIVILGETLFPIAMIAPAGVLGCVLLLFAIFHLSNAFFMGLNTFVWSFIACYPSVVLLNEIIYFLANG